MNQDTDTPKEDFPPPPTLPPVPLIDPTMSYRPRRVWDDFKPGRAEQFALGSTEHMLLSTAVMVVAMYLKLENPEACRKYGDDRWPSFSERAIQACRSGVIKTYDHHPGTDVFAIDRESFLRWAKKELGALPKALDEWLLYRESQRDGKIPKGKQQIEEALKFRNDQLKSLGAALRFVANHPEKCKGPKHGITGDSIYKAMSIEGITFPLEDRTVINLLNRHLKG